MPTRKKSSRGASRSMGSKRPARPNPIPADPLLFSRMLLSAKDDRSVERLANEYLARTQQAFQPGRINSLADIHYKLKDTLGTAGAGMWDRYVSVAAKWLQLRTYEYYPYNKVPAVPAYFLSKTKPYDEEPFTHHELPTAVGPPPSNPDNEISVKSGYASFHPDNGDGVLQAVLLNGRGILGYGPGITIDTDGASSVYISCSVHIAYLFTFDASFNPRFDPVRYYVPCYMSGALWLGNQSDVWDRTTGIGYNNSTLDRRLIRSVGLFPEGFATGTGQYASPEVHFGLAQQFSDDLVVTYKTNLNLPANSRCAFQLGLWCDVTAVGPRNGRWNRFVCNSQVQASANIPRIDVDVWPLV